MYLENLSTSVLRLCDTRKLSYETASELCCISSRYFGDIARGKAIPSVATLEKLCNGFDLTPNDLLLTPAGRPHHMPVPVTRLHCSGNLLPACPRCGQALERESQRYCSGCGQRLDWTAYRRLTPAGK